jgi:hypothetical protein
MTSRATRIILTVLLAGLQQVSFAQGKTPAASWLFPGVSWRASDKVHLQGQLPGSFNHVYSGAN